MTALALLCAEHAAFEHAPLPPDGQAARLGAVLADETSRVCAWVAVLRGRHVGYATVSEEFSTWRASWYVHLDCLFVQDAHRGAGIGARLLAAVIAHARHRGSAELQWQTPAWNAGAARFYRRHGALAHDKLRFHLPVSSVAPLS